MSSKRRKKAESEVAKLLDLGDGSGGASSGTDHVGGANNGDVSIELSENRKQKLQTLLTKVVREKDGAREARTWIMAHPRCARAIGAELESLVCKKSKTGSGGKKLMVLRVLHDVLGKCHAMRSEGKKLPVDYESVWLSVLETAVRECLAPESPEKVVESFNKYFDKWKEKGWLGLGSIAVLDERVREIKRRQKDRVGSTASPSAKAKTTAAPLSNSSTGLTSAFRSARSNATPNRKVAFASALSEDPPRAPAMPGRSDGSLLQPSSMPSSTAKSESGMASKTTNSSEGWKPPSERGENPREDSPRDGRDGASPDRDGAELSQSRSPRARLRSPPPPPRRRSRSPRRWSPSPPPMRRRRSPSPPPFRSGRSRSPLPPLPPSPRRWSRSRSRSPPPFRAPRRPYSPPPPRRGGLSPPRRRWRSPSPRGFRGDGLRRSPPRGDMRRPRRSLSPRGRRSPPFRDRDRRPSPPGARPSHENEPKTSSAKAGQNKRKRKRNRKSATSRNAESAKESESATSETKSSQQTLDATLGKSSSGEAKDKQPEIKEAKLKQAKKAKKTLSETKEANAKGENSNGTQAAAAAAATASAASTQATAKASSADIELEDSLNFSP